MVLALKSSIKNFLWRLINKIPFIEKPLPKYPFGKKPWATKKKYLKLFDSAKHLDDTKVIAFENKLGYKIDKNWVDTLALKTQIVIKKESLNYFHGRLLYAVLSRYINSNINKLDDEILVLETGTARGFSSLCLSKAIIDNDAKGKIITIDSISHNEEIFWNCIVDNEGP